MSGWDSAAEWSGGGTSVIAASGGWNAGAETAGNWNDGVTAGSNDNVEANGAAPGGEGETNDGAMMANGGDDRTCRICNEPGHMARECPAKPEGFGHITSDCTNNKVFDYDKVDTLSVEDAWAGLIKAAKEAAESRELDDFRDAIKAYQKAIKEVSYEELERSFRLHKLGIYIIATEPRTGEVLDTHTLINLVGKRDCTYKVGYYFKKTPRSANLAEVWPSSEEENLERLKDAGIPFERGIPKCFRCKEMGHTGKACTQEQMEMEKAVIKCVNCDEEGHRARDCTVARVDRFACRNCNEEGHMSKECDKPKNPATSTCRNCDEVGHFSKDCPKPRDWSKVKCNTCGESKFKKAIGQHPPLTYSVGHTVRRCPQANAGEGAAGAGGFENGNTGATEGAGGWGGGEGGGSGAAAEGSGWETGGAAAQPSGDWDAPASTTASAW
ncbi:MAG: hypothetical protein Q9220_007266 [cf. Caloplaca sp. 1 TL-2023]